MSGRQPMTAEVVPQIKADLAELVATFDPKASATYSFALMASVFYDIEAALDAGATQRQVVEIFAKNQAAIPLHRFGQHLTRLRGLFPARHRPPDVRSDVIVAVASELAAIAPAPVVPPTVTLTPRRKMTRHVPQRGRPIVVPMHDKMTFCGDAVLEIAKGAVKDYNKFAAGLRARLGPGWTVKTTLQFVAGSNFEEWLEAPWQSDAERQGLVMAHHIARALVDDRKKLPPIDQLPKLASAAYKRLQQTLQRATP